MENIWSFLLQTLSVSLIGLLLLVVKLLLRNRLSPRWQYAVWGVLAVRLMGACVYLWKGYFSAAPPLGGNGETDGGAGVVLGLYCFL